MGAIGPGVHVRAGIWCGESGPGFGREPLPDAVGPGVRRTALAVYRAPGGMPVAAKGYTLFLMANEE